MNDTQPNQNQPISDAFRKFVQCNCCKRHQKNRPLFLDFLCVQKCSANLSDVAKIKRTSALKICNCKCRRTARMIVRSLGVINDGSCSYTSKCDKTGRWIIVHCDKNGLEKRPNSA